MWVAEAINTLAPAPGTQCLFIFSVGIRAGYLSARSVDILIESDAFCVSGPDFPGVHNGFVVPLAVTLMSGLIGDLVARLPPLAADRIAHPK